MTRTAAARPPFGNAAKPHRILAGGARFLSTPGFNAWQFRAATAAPQRDSGAAVAARFFDAWESGGTFAWRTNPRPGSDAASRHSNGQTQRTATARPPFVFTAPSP